MRRRGPAWQVLRANHLRTYPECRACDSDQDVIVHHLCYRGTAGSSERSGDLVTLCADCHEELHRELGGVPKRDAQLEFSAQRRRYRDEILIGIVS